MKKNKEVDALKDILTSTININKVSDMLLECIYCKFIIDSAIKFINEQRIIWNEWHYDGYDVDADIERLLDILRGIDKE